MDTYTIKVSNGDEGHDLGTFEGPLPIVGAPFLLWHPAICEHPHQPFEGVVSAVVWEAAHPLAVNGHGDAKKSGTVEVVVWLAAEAQPVTLYCECTPEKREEVGVDDDGDCENCGRVVPEGAR
jgi:hypothetical protein